MYTIHPSNVSSWRYQSEDELDGSSSTGNLATYSGAGSVQDLSTLRNQTAAIIAELQEGLWITRGTRVVIVDFTVYNANINLFCIVM